MMLVQANGILATNKYTKESVKMTIQTINLGSYANDGTGDDLRTAFEKVNANFSELNAEAAISTAVNVGSGTGVWKDKNGVTLEFKSLTSTGNSVVITNTSNTINLEAISSVHSDTNPTLSNNLNLNGYYIYGGDVTTTVHGVDPRAADTALSLLLENNNFVIDMGAFVTPTGYETENGGYLWDFGSILAPVNSEYNFGDLNPAANFSLEGGNNTTLTLGGNFTTVGAYPITLTTTAATSLVLPPSGVLASASNALSQFASTSSSQLASVISDETGTGLLVFNSSPTFTGTISASNVSASGYIYLTGNLAVNGTKFEVDAATGNTIVAGTLNVTGTSTLTNITRSGLEISSANYITVSSTATYALSTTVTDNILTITNSGYTATLTFPPSPVDGQRLRFTCAGGFSATLALTAGPTLVNSFIGGVTTPATFTYVYRSSNNSWYRLQ